MGLLHLCFRNTLRNKLKTLTRLNAKGSVFVEYATLSTIVGVTIIGALSLFVRNHDNYRDIVVSLNTYITEANNSTTSQSPDGDGSSSNSPHGSDEKIEPEDTLDPDAEEDGNCFEYRNLGSGYNRKSGILQIKINGGMIGYHNANNFRETSTHYFVEDVSAIRDESQDLLLVVEYNEANGYFTIGDAISVFSFDGSTKIIGRSRLKGGSGRWHQGDDYLVTTDSSLMLSLKQLSLIQSDINIDKSEKALDKNGLFNFQNIGCLSFPDGKKVQWKS